VNNELTPEEEARSIERYNQIKKVKIENAERSAKHQIIKTPKESIQKKQVLVKTYVGNQQIATRKFRKDLDLMADEGYFPKSQSWSAGSYSFSDFLVALLLCLILIGFLVFIYMLIVKPNGVLTVTYELRADTQPLADLTKEKVCPQCAENIKEAAKICRFCGYSYSN
jgi:Uncharacterised protein family UPF0547